MDCQTQIMDKLHSPTSFGACKAVEIVLIQFGTTQDVTGAADALYQRARHDGRFINEDLMQYTADLPQVGELPARRLDSQTLSGAQEGRGVHCAASSDELRR